MGRCPIDPSIKDLPLGAEAADKSDVTSAEVQNLRTRHLLLSPRLLDRESARIIFRLYSTSGLTEWTLFGFLSQNTHAIWFGIKLAVAAGEAC